uniref:transposase n=1 Tax=Dongshaea marina TaxID=2047966 RepID=UPI001F2C619F|nr:transposase [Dongshaea marina]
MSSSISSDANDFVKLQPRTNRLTWSLASKRWKSDLNNPVYTQAQHLGIIEIMNYVNQKTGYLSAFGAIASRKKSATAMEEDLIGCIFGNGANYGLHRMASISDRNLGSLRGVNDTYIRPETTGAANDIISNAIAKLPIFRYYTINEEAPFGSIDGQKHRCRINTFKARYSAKYFQTGKGVSALTLVVNHVPVNATVNAPNEYEGHFAFDLLYNNSSEVQPKSLATDTHGVNSVNFAILDIFGYQFAPRYAKFKRVFEEMFEVTFGDKLMISLRKPINRKLIEQEWGNIQHIICSLSRKSTSQSTIIKKLANDKRKSKTLVALREYDRLIKSLYLLEYADNITLRQFVQQALNRGEAYHQLRRVIASVNGNQFRGGDDYQVEQWNDCARLIANCIIYYNSALLSGLVEKYEEQGDQQAIDILTNLSPVAWNHIQLAGNYRFAEQKETFTIESVLEGINPILDPVRPDEPLAA